jgi:hypothetical protein
MGNDGGSIPTRRELVKNAARELNTTELKATQQEAQTHAWTYCPLSNQPLISPIVSDSAGTLYNKDAILEFLLPQDEPAPAIVTKEREAVLGGRVKCLRDVVEVHFTTDGEKKICPITRKELGASTRAVYLVPCGHAFSEAAIRQLAAETCTECSEPYAAENVIPILPLAAEDVSKLTARAAKLKAAGLTHSLKKAPGSKKRKKNAEADADAAPATTTEAKSNGEDHEVKSRTAHTPPVTQPRNGTSTAAGAAAPASSGIKNAATASLTSRVLEEQEERNKRRKLEMNDNLKTLFSKTKHDTGADFMTRGFSIPKRA